MPSARPGLYSPLTGDASFLAATGVEAVQEPRVCHAALPAPSCLVGGVAFGTGGWSEGWNGVGVFWLDKVMDSGCTRPLHLNHNAIRDPWVRHLSTPHAHTHLSASSTPQPGDLHPVLEEGDNLSTGNLYNIQAVLFMWVVLPANSASTMPTLVMERQLFTRCCLHRAGVWGCAAGCVGDMAVVGAGRHS